MSSSVITTAVDVATDAQPPQAVVDDVHAETDPRGHTTTIRIDLEYLDPSGIDVESLSVQNLRLIRSDGLERLLDADHIHQNDDRTVVHVTYSLASPPNGWSDQELGTYSLQMGQVADLLGNRYESVTTIGELLFVNEDSDSEPTPVRKPPPRETFGFFRGSGIQVQLPLHVIVLLGDLTMPDETDTDDPSELDTPAEDIVDESEHRPSPVTLETDFEQQIQQLIPQSAVTINPTPDLIWSMADEGRSPTRLYVRMTTGTGLQSTAPPRTTHISGTRGPGTPATPIQINTDIRNDPRFFATSRKNAFEDSFFASATSKGPASIQPDTDQSSLAARQLSIQTPGEIDDPLRLFHRGADTLTIAIASDLSDIHSPIKTTRRTMESAAKDGVPATEPIATPSSETASELDAHQTPSTQSLTDPTSDEPAKHTPRYVDVLSAPTVRSRPLQHIETIAAALFCLLIGTVLVRLHETRWTGLLPHTRIDGFRSKFLRDKNGQNSIKNANGT